MVRRDVNDVTTPHPDGRRESIINDSEGKQIGIRADMPDDFSSLNQINDDKMKRFEKMMRGTPADEEK